MRTAPTLQVRRGGKGIPFARGVDGVRRQERESEGGRFEYCPVRHSRTEATARRFDIGIIIDHMGASRGVCLPNDWRIEARQKTEAKQDQAAHGGPDDGVFKEPKGRLTCAKLAIGDQCPDSQGDARDWRALSPCQAKHPICPPS